MHAEPTPAPERFYAQQIDQTWYVMDRRGRSLDGAPTRYAPVREGRTAARSYADLLNSEEAAERCTTCGGAGEVTVGVSRDSFGNWDTREYPCPDCADDG